MAERIKKSFFKLLPGSIVFMMIIALVAVGWQSQPTTEVKAVAASITFNSGTLTLTNDADANGIANIGDTVSVSANITNTDGNGVDPNETTVTADLSAFGCGAAVAMDVTDGLEGNTAEAWGPVTCVITAGTTDVGINTQVVSITYSDADDAAASSNTSVLAEAFDNQPPVVSALYLTADESACTGAGGTVCKIGDTITFSWNDTITGDNNTDTISTVTADLTAFGGTAAEVLTNAADTWSVAFVVLADNDDGTNTFTATATDNAGNATTSAASTDTAPVDNIAPIITVPGTITLTDVGGDGVASIGDTLTYAAGTVSVADGDTWTVDLSAYGLSATAAPGAYVVIADNDDGAFSATETVTDNGGNTATGAVTVTGFTNIDNIAPIITVPGTITLTDVGGDGVASIGDTLTYAAGTVSVADGDTWTVDLSAYGLSATAAPGAYVVIADNDDGAFSATETVTDNGGNTDTGAVTVTGFTNIDNIAPIITDGNISISGASGNGGAYIIGDTVTATWNNTLGGDNNADIAGVTVDFSEFGGGAAVVATNSLDTWTATYTIVAGAIDGTNINVSVTATDDGGNVTGPVADTTNATVDNIAPSITAVEMFDVDNDGSIDEVLLTFNDNIIDATVTANDITIGGTNADTVLATTSTNGTDGNVANDNQITIAVAAGVVGTEAKELVHFAGTLTDDAGNALPFQVVASGSVTDSAAPVKVSSTPAEGSIGQSRLIALVVTFSEPMAAAGSLTDTDGATNDANYVISWPDTVTMNSSHDVWSPSFAEIITLNGFTAAAGTTTALAGDLTVNFTTVGTSGGGGGGGSCSTPTGTISINAGATATTTRTVTLNLTSENATEVIVSENAYFIDASYQAVSSEIAFTLSEVEETKTVYAMFRGSCGTSAQVSDTIVYDISATEQDQQPVETPQEPPQDTLILQDPAPAPALSAEVQAVTGVGELVKRPDMTAVYFIDQDNRRHAFPNENTYFSWFADFSQVKTISADILAQIPLGSNVTVRAGTNLVKIQTLPHVYAVEPYGVLRWVSSRAVAEKLYGLNWENRLDIVPDTFFVNYQMGADLTGDTHPTGSLIRYGGEAAVYLVADGVKHPVSSLVFDMDLFQDKFVSLNVSTDLSYPTGNAYPILPWETLMAIR